MNNNIYTKRNKILKYLLLSLCNFSYESKENYQFRSLFEIVIPVHLDNNQLELEAYLPNDLNIDDKNKIIEFIKENNKISSRNNFYKLTFSKKNIDSNSLENIEIQEYEPSIPKSLKVSSPTKKTYKKKEFFKENFLIIKINSLKQLERIDNELSLDIFLSGKKMLDKVNNYIKNKYTIYQNILYELLFDTNKKQIIGLKINIDNKHQEILYVFYSSNNKYIIFNNKMEIINQFIISLQVNGPTNDSLQKLGNPFNFRRDPFTGKTRMHRGQDIRLSNNTLIRSIDDGIIVDAGYNKDYGYFIIVHHGHSTKNSYSSVYCHLNQIFYPTGTNVLKNQIICLSGNTGRSTGPHLHFEIIDNFSGNRVNPMFLHKTYKKVNVIFFNALKEYFLSLIESVNNNF